jgi:hypothetical protein
MGPTFKTAAACDAAVKALSGPRRFHNLAGYPKFGGGFEVQAICVALE